MKTLILISLFLIAAPLNARAESEFEAALSLSAECKASNECSNGLICVGYHSEQTFNDSIPDMNIFGPRTYPEIMGSCMTQARLDSLSMEPIETVEK